jgi:hypothetical protein
MLLVAALEDSEALVRREAARGLQRLHNPEATAALLKAIADDTPMLARTAVWGQQAGANAFGERDIDVRIEAAYALGQYPEPRVFEALKEALWDRSLAVNAAAASSLRYLTGEDFGLSRTDWERWGASSRDLFAGQLEYEYPVFQRDRRLLEYIPLWPQPPNEEPAPPVGLPRIEG